MRIATASTPATPAPSSPMESAIREVLALYVQGHPCDSISFGATVTIVCTNPISAARWMERTPNGVLPESGVPVQVVTLDGAFAALAEVPC